MYSRETNRGLIDHKYHAPQSLHGALYFLRATSISVWNETLLRGIYEKARDLDGLDATSRGDFFTSNRAAAKQHTDVFHRRDYGQ